MTLSCMLFPSLCPQVCRNVPQPRGVSHPYSRAQEDVTAPASMAASVTCTSTESCRTWRPGWGQGQQAPVRHRAPPDSGWAKGWSQAASPAREVPVSKVTAMWRGTVASPAPATQAGQGHCVTSKSTIHVMGTSEWLFCVSLCLCVKYFFTCPSLNPPQLSILRCIHGTCLPINSYSYSCRCQPGFSGVLCDEQDQDTTNPCSLFRCKHGKCRVSGLGKAYCECFSGYTGEACDRGEKKEKLIVFFNVNSRLIF